MGGSVDAINQDHPIVGSPDNKDEDEDKDNDNDKKKDKDKDENENEILFEEAIDDLSSKLNLTFSLCSIPGNMNNINTALIIYSINKNNDKIKVGETEIIANNNNPTFVKSTMITYKFEEQQNLLVQVFLIDKYSYNTKNLELCKHIGKCYFNLHELVRSQNKALSLKLKLISELEDKVDVGSIIIFANEINKGPSHTFEFEFQGFQFTEEKIFYKIFVPRKDNYLEYKPIYQSKPAIKNKFNLHLFQENEIHVFSLYSENENYKQNYKIIVFQFNNAKNHIVIGEGNFNILKIGSDEKIIKILDKNQLYKGELIAKKAILKQRKNFLDYIFGGIEISLTIAIDFTLSNLDPNDKNSLHTSNLSSNQYLQAITSVGEILEHYDSTKRITLLGFGAKIPGILEHRASSCFALNGNIFKSEVNGLNEVIDTYKKVLPKLNFHGPTNFADIINHTSQMAQFEVKELKKIKYYLLLILTDGMISDLKEAINEVVFASALPISIIIVGIGNEDFKDMIILDADVNPLYSGKYNKQMERSFKKRYSSICSF